MSTEQLPQVADELRQYIVDVISEIGNSHFGASLGVVELTVALHYVFNTPDDQLVWDVGHQAYGHKILTGRRSVFHTNRTKGGISGFPKRSESEYDTFGVGHSSTSISAALGMAVANRYKGDKERQHIAVIGDGQTIIIIGFAIYIPSDSDATAASRQHKSRASAVCVDNHIACIGLVVIGGGNIIIKIDGGTGNCKSSITKAGNTNCNIIDINDSNTVITGIGQAYGYGKIIGWTGEVNGTIHRIE